MTHSNSVRSIRNRLFLLLLRAFVIVVAFLILFTLLATGLILAYPSQSNPLYRLPTIARLETYYIARGSWDGVNAIFANSLDIEVFAMEVLHPAGCTKPHHRGARAHRLIPPISLTYQPVSGETVIPIMVNGELVGKLVVGQNTQPPERRFTFRFLQPVAAGLAHPGGLCHLDRPAAHPPGGHAAGRSHRRGGGDRRRPSADPRAGRRHRTTCAT